MTHQVQLRVQPLHLSRHHLRVRPDRSDGLDPEGGDSVNGPGVLGHDQCGKE